MYFCNKRATRGDTYFQVMKKLVILTGAGMSAESGFETFRDAGGLWERYPVEKVATPEGWAAAFCTTLVCKSIILMFQY